MEVCRVVTVKWSERIRLSDEGGIFDVDICDYNMGTKLMKHIQIICIHYLQYIYLMIVSDI